MRTVPKDIADKLIKNIQTKGTSANPSTVAWISRPTTALTDDTFLEKQTVLDGTFTDVSIAVCHPYFGFTNTKLNMAYISNGKANVMVAIHRTSMAAHEWYETGFSEDASAVALAFDGKMPKNMSGKYEFVTETQPWVFWVSSGVLYAQKIDGEFRYTLAEANCTDVTAVRAMWSDVPGFDFGLCVFFILSGAIYYRQFIDGVWTDAEPIPASALPLGQTWTQVSAQRTWDYRVALQVVNNAGAMYEAFTQFGGIGSKGAEHLELKRIDASGELVKVTYTNLTPEEEHVEISGITAGAPYGGLYSSGVPSMVHAENVAVNAVNPETQEPYLDYGKRIRVRFDIHLTASEVLAQANSFSLVDSLGVHFLVGSSTLDEDGLTVILDFGSFNNAVGSIVVAYTAGTITSMAGVSLVNTNITFDPIGLVRTIPPRIESIENI